MLALKTGKIQIFICRNGKIGLVSLYSKIGTSVSSDDDNQVCYIFSMDNVAGPSNSDTNKPTHFEEDITEKLFMRYR